MHPLRSPSFFCLLCYAVLCLVSLCNFLLRRLAVCNITELMLCGALKNCVIIIIIIIISVLFLQPFKGPHLHVQKHLGKHQ
jgi:hypothetical protein